MKPNTSHGGRPRKSDRSPKKLTPDFVYSCGKLFCTQEEIGGLCGLSQGRVSEILNSDDELRLSYLAGRSQAKMSLRRAQYKKAVEDGNLVAQIWLGKQELGQADKNDTHEHHDVNINIQYIAAWGKTPQELPPPPSPDYYLTSDTTEVGTSDSETIDSTAIEDEDPPPSAFSED
jgi:hypothetical protein